VLLQRFTALISNLREMSSARHFKTDALQNAEQEPVSPHATKSVSSMPSVGLIACCARMLRKHVAQHSALPCCTTMPLEQ
jgi:hypothetical protein